MSSALPNPRFLPLLLALATLAGPAGASDRVQRISCSGFPCFMEIFYLDYNLFTTLENLDDTFGSPGNPTYQYINDGGGALVIVPNTGQIRRQVLVQDPFGVAGPPYYGYGSNFDFEGPAGDYDEGTPLDPWDHPYYFYSPLGLFEPRTGTYSLRYYGDSFYYYTIVSHGPDGQYGGGDDITGQIFISITVPAISAARLTANVSRAPGLYDLTIRGFNLGASQGSGDVLFDGAPAGGTVSSWSAGQIVLSLNAPPSPSAQVTVRTGGGTITRTVPVTDLTGTLVPDWDLY